MGQNACCLSLTFSSPTGQTQLTHTRFPSSATVGTVFGCSSVRSYLPRKYTRFHDRRLWIYFDFGIGLLLDWLIWLHHRLPPPLLRQHRRLLQWMCLLASVHVVAEG